MISSTTSIDGVHCSINIDFTTTIDGTNVIGFAVFWLVLNDFERTWYYKALKSSALAQGQAQTQKPNMQPKFCD